MFSLAGLGMLCGKSQQTLCALVKAFFCAEWLTRNVPAMPAVEAQTHKQGTKLTLSFRKQAFGRASCFFYLFIFLIFMEPELQ